MVTQQSSDRVTSYSSLSPSRPWILDHIRSYRTGCYSSPRRSIHFFYSNYLVKRLCSISLLFIIDQVKKVTVILLCLLVVECKRIVSVPEYAIYLLSNFSSFVSCRRYSFLTAKDHNRYYGNIYHSAQNHHLFFLKLSQHTFSTSLLKTLFIHIQFFHDTIIHNH